MNTYRSDIAADQFAATKGSSSRMPQGQLIGGQLVMAQAKIVAQSDMAVGDCIELVQLPKGAIIIPHLCKIHTEGLGTTFSVTIGTREDAALYSGAISIKTTGELAFSGGTGLLNAMPSLASVTVNAYITAASAISAGKTAMCRIAYIIP